jgi:hypothetical protein
LAFGEKQFWKIAMFPHTVQASSQDIKGIHKLVYSQMWLNLLDDCQCGDITKLKEKNWFRPAMIFEYYTLKIK